VKLRRAPLVLVVPSTQQRGVEFADFSISLSDRYTSAIIAAGGIPWIMPVRPGREFVRECVARAAGVMLTGGDDVEPTLYRRRTPANLRRTVTLVDPRRDELEFQVIDEALAQRKPLFAICRGIQVLNVALGGTLIVDIPLEVPGALRHNRPDRKNDPVHEVALTPQSQLTRILGVETLGVNSSHHQAIGRLARSLQITARSADGIVEAVELKPPARRSPWLVAVQFHPERMSERYPEFLTLFRSFTLACSGRSKKL
jgi:putative glutamine amidotransferase